MINSDINEFKRYVQETLIKKYHMTEIEVHRAVRDSYLSKALSRDKEYVDHDAVEEWADFIYEKMRCK